jgi:D-alanine-D-alanine ligase
LANTIIVLFGGRSDERHVSVASAQNIARTLGNPLCWFWSPEGAVYDVSIPDLLAHQRPFEVDFVPARPAIWPDLEQALATMPVDDPVMLLALHGGEGEDGTVQAMLEARRIPFTGSGSKASAAAFDKGRAKEIVHGRVRTAESEIVPAGDAASIGTRIRTMLQRFPKIALKPLAAGSSRGLFFVDSESDIDSIAAKIAALRLPYIFEQFVAGREVTVGIVDEGHGAFALPCLEIEVDPGFAFDYEGKYLGKGTREICPANLPDDIAGEAQRTALEAHLALGCEGYSRSDLVVAEDGVYFLETNTLPGMTTSSLVPQELSVANISFRDFLEKQVELAWQRSNA